MAGSRVTGAGPLALVGGDELNPGNEEQDRVLVEAAAGGPAFVLATAAARQHPEDAVRNAQRWFERLGLEVRELPATRRSDATSPEQVELARTGRLFYLVGGDPGLVPTILSETPMWAAIVEAWRSGAALAGSSAGAMALGEWTLIRARFPGDRNRRPRPALTLVPGTAVIPHFDTFGAGWVAGTLETAPGPDAVLVGIDERSAALWRDGTWRAYGPGAVTVIARGEQHRFGSGRTIEGIPQPLG
ncbi:MAG: Type 1 glutamine amidotransferase-like domain-containing protein [Candidatus Velamenicoccus archaeovorus]